MGLIGRSAVYHNLTPSVVNHVNRHILALNVESLLVQLRNRGEPGASWMIVTSQLFEAYIECPTKCWLRSRGEPTAGNVYAEWTRAQNEVYRRECLKNLLATLPKSNCAMGPPISKNSKDATWRIAIDVRLRTNYLESRPQAVEKTASEGRGSTAQFIPYRFEFANKLTKEHKLLLAFDAVVLAEVVGRAVNLGKIVHGDSHTAPVARMPTFTVSNDPNASRGQTVALSSLISIADPDNVGYQKLEQWDSAGTVGGGQFAVNGTPQTGGHEIDISLANVANTVFDVGMLGGADRLWAQLLQNNGQLTGWQPFTVTVPQASLSVHSVGSATKG